MDTNSTHSDALADFLLDMEKGIQSVTEFKQLSLLFLKHSSLQQLYNQNNQKEKAITQPF